MGYWTTARDGTSFALELHADGSPLMWGDAPADVMDEALQQILAVFKEDVGRVPSLDELIAGLRFSAFALEDELADPKVKAAESN